jgi:hypothetical protein
VFVAAESSPLALAECDVEVWREDFGVAGWVGVLDTRRFGRVPFRISERALRGAPSPLVAFQRLAAQVEMRLLAVARGGYD